MEKTETDRRFRNAIYGLLVLLVAAYGIYKYQMVAMAFDHWEGEQISVPKGLAAK